MKNWSGLLLIAALASSDLNLLIKQGYKEQKESYQKIQQLLKNEHSKVVENQVAQLEDLSSMENSGESYQVVLKSK